MGNHPFLYLFGMRSAVVCIHLASLRFYTVTRRSVRYGTPLHESGRTAETGECRQSSRVVGRMSRLLKSTVARRTIPERSFNASISCFDSKTTRLRNTNSESIETLKSPLIYLQTDRKVRYPPVFNQGRIEKQHPIRILASWTYRVER